MQRMPLKKWMAPSFVAAESTSNGLKALAVPMSASVTIAASDVESLAILQGIAVRHKAETAMAAVAEEAEAEEEEDADIAIEVIGEDVVRTLLTTAAALLRRLESVPDRLLRTAVAAIDQGRQKKDDAVAASRRLSPSARHLQRRTVPERKTVTAPPAHPPSEQGEMRRQWRAPTTRNKRGDQMG